MLFNKILKALFVLLIAISSVDTNAQIKLGLVLGANMSGNSNGGFQNLTNTNLDPAIEEQACNTFKVSSTSPNLLKNGKPGINIGFFTSFPLSKKFDFQSGLILESLYTGFNYTIMSAYFSDWSDAYTSYDFENIKITYHTYNLNIPLFINYKIKNSGKGNILLFAGPQLSFGLFGNGSIPYNVSSYYVSETTPYSNNYSFNSSPSFSDAKTNTTLSPYFYHKLDDPLRAFRYSICTGLGYELNNFTIKLYYTYYFNNNIDIHSYNSVGGAAIPFRYITYQQQGINLSVFINLLHFKNKDNTKA